MRRKDVDARHEAGHDGLEAAGRLLHLRHLLLLLTSPSEQCAAFSATQLRYLKAIRSVRLSVEALSFKASFAAFALC
jgi:hypothetical protein